VIDPTVRWEVDAGRLASRARNTPFAGRKLIGRVRHTVFRGEPVVIDGEATR
jgi:dihydroorotase